MAILVGSLDFILCSPVGPLVKLNEPNHMCDSTDYTVYFHNTGIKATSNIHQLQDATFEDSWAACGALMQSKDNNLQRLEKKG